MHQVEIIATRVQRALSKGDLRSANTLAEREVAAGGRHPVLYQAMAEARIAAGRYQEAGDLLNKGLALNRANPDCLCALAVLLAREDRLDDAVGVFAQTLKLAPDNGRAWMGLGQALEKLQNEDRALGAFERAAALNPKDAAPVAAAADLHWRDGRKEKAREAVEQALALEPGNVTARLVAGRMALAEGRAADAQTQAETALARRRGASEDHMLAQKLLADALDLQDRVPEAVNAYNRMNQTAVELNRERFGQGGHVEDHREFMARIVRAYRQHSDQWRDAPPSCAPSPAARHVFILGYPRAGNTLAAAMLGRSPGAAVLEEQPTLLDIGLEYLRDDESVARLAGAGTEEVERLRGVYWNRVRRLAPEFKGGLFVDMSPMNGLNAPIIRKLFPDAAIVFCRRDPRDVVLSCWRQPFQMSAGAYQMTSIAGAARHFAAAMQSTEACLEISGGGAYVLDYEVLIDDFNGGARKLFEAAGIDWSDEALRFADADKTRRLRTASAEQIRLGLFDGRGRWRRYQAYLEPVMPILAPWIA